MFSYQQISRWLSVPLDPITVEDWLANREIFGPGKATLEEEELERAYQVEEIRAKKDEGLEVATHSPFVLLNGLEVSGLVDQDYWLAVVPVGRGKPVGRKILDVQLVIDGENQKFDVHFGDVVVVSLAKGQAVSVFARCHEGFRIGKDGFVRFSGEAKTKIIFDTRGRPIPTFDSNKQQELMVKMKDL